MLQGPAPLASVLSQVRPPNGNATGFLLLCQSHPPPVQSPSPRTQLSDPSKCYTKEHNCRAIALCCILPAIVPSSCIVKASGATIKKRGSSNLRVHRRNYASLPIVTVPSFVAATLYGTERILSFNRTPPSQHTYIHTFKYNYLPGYSSPVEQAIEGLRRDYFIVNSQPCPASPCAQYVCPSNAKTPLTHQPNLRRSESSIVLYILIDQRVVIVSGNNCDKSGHICVGCARFLHPPRTSVCRIRSAVNSELFPTADLDRLTKQLQIERSPYPYLSKTAYMRS
jgi:hypothetical protein